mmetsp:Transcript_3353/g.5597  ORF Transcript_3353/g.5597 Transcript_3353/m.5597 type:complete len:228 (-) Transcript_3353:61-744(-)
MVSSPPPLGQREGGDASSTAAESQALDDVNQKTGNLKNLPNFGNYGVHGNQNVYNKFNDYQLQGVDISMGSQNLRAQNKFYSNREQRAFSFYQENNTMTANDSFVLNYYHNPSRFKQKYRDFKSVMKPEFYSSQDPTATDFVRNPKLRFAQSSEKPSSSHNKLSHSLKHSLANPVTLNCVQPKPIDDKQKSLWLYQTQAHPAGYSNFGPQMAPLNVPQQKNLYLYKR